MLKKKIMEMRWKTKYMFKYMGNSICLIIQTFSMISLNSVGDEVQKMKFF